MYPRSQMQKQMPPRRPWPLQSGGGRRGQLTKVRVTQVPFSEKEMAAGAEEEAFQALLLRL
jgi:hypothetical protein